MKKILFFVLVLFVGIAYSQDKKVKYEPKGDLVEATYYYNNGQVEQHGFFKDEKLHGTWKYYNEEGNEVAIGNYKEGKKTGKWVFKNNGNVKEVEYLDGKIISVNESASGTSI